MEELREKEIIMYRSNFLEDSHTVIAADGNALKLREYYYINPYMLSRIQYYYLVSISVYMHIANG